MKWLSGDLLCELGILCRSHVAIEALIVVGSNMVERHCRHRLRWFLKAKTQPEYIAILGKSSTCVSSVHLYYMWARKLVGHI